MIDNAINEQFWEIAPIGSSRIRSSRRWTVQIGLFCHRATEAMAIKPDLARGSAPMGVGPIGSRGFMSHRSYLCRPSERIETPKYIPDEHVDFRTERAAQTPHLKFRVDFS